MIHDVIISGAGPAGLSAAFFLADKGFKVLVLEKNSRSGAFPRAETLRDNEVLDEVLGKGFMKSISLYETAARKFNSPGVKKHFLVYRETASYLFDWQKMIKRMEDRAREAGAEIIFDAKVEAPIIRNGICRGVMLTDGRSFESDTVFACDGYSSRLGVLSGVDYSRINCPIAKKIITDSNFDYDGMEFFFIAEKSLSFAPDFPASILFIFPRGNREVETGLMVLTSTFLKKHRENEIPGEPEVVRVLNRLITEYPSYSEKLKGGTVRFEGASTLPMAGLFDRMMTVPGLVLAGDVIGFVEASGGCGVVSSVKSVRFASEFLAANRGRDWNPELMEQMNREFRRTEIFRHIRRVYRIVLPVLNFFFSTLGTEKRINRYWKLIKFFYKLG